MKDPKEGRMERVAGERRETFSLNGGSEPPERRQWTDSQNGFRRS